MAPNLPKIKRAELESVIISKLQGEETITDNEIGRIVVGCSDRSVRNGRTNILKYGTINAPRDKVGRPKKITKNMWFALRVKYDESDGMTYQAMADFLEQLSGERINKRTVEREVKRQNWTRHVPEDTARERDQDLRDDYLARRSEYPIDTIICVDESSFERTLAIPKTALGPKGARRRRVRPFHRGKSLQVLPAYTIDGVIYYEVYEDNTDSNVFEGFVERLLPHCNPFPQPHSVIIMDNAPIHFSKRLEHMIAKAGVILEYTSPWSPDVMPIEWWFGSLKNIIRAKAYEDEDDIRGDFKSYINLQIGLTMADTRSAREKARRMARGHFRLCGFDVDIDVDIDVEEDV